MAIKPPFVRSPYNYDMNEASDASGLKCEDPSLTQQQFAEESDINFIAERYGLTGEMPQVVNSSLAYGDFSGVFDFQSAQNAIIAARQQFMTLPAKMRARFGNDPQQLLAFLQDPENRAEAEFLGILDKQQPPKENADGPRRTEHAQGTPQDATGSAGTAAATPKDAPAEGT